MQSLRKTGIDVVGEVSWSTHFCQFYHSRQDLLDTLIPYFKSGLENNEFCFWVTSKPLDRKEALKVLADSIPCFQDYLDRGQIEVITYLEWYLKEGSFAAQRVLDAWVEKINSALQKGYAGLRLSGNTLWLEKKDWRKFTEYETELNRFVHKNNILALCTYKLDKCHAMEVIDIIRNHDFALIQQDRKWELIENSDIKRAEAALAFSLVNSPDRNKIDRNQSKNTDDLEIRVRERTAQLEKVNLALNNEIDQHRHAREKISAIAASFYNLIESNANGILIISNQGIIRFANPAAEKLLDCSVNELKDKLFEYPLVAGERTEIDILQGDGSLASAEMSVVSTEWEGEPCFLATLSNITERKLAELALRKSKMQLESLFNTMVEGVTLVDKNGQVIKANLAMERIAGFPLSQIENCSYIWQGRRAVYPDGSTIKAADLPVSRSLRDKEVVRGFEMGLERNDGSIVWLRVNSVPILDHNNNLEGVVRTSTDITEWKRLEDTIKQNEAQLRLMLDQIPSMLWVIDTDLKFTLSLGAGLRAFNLKPGQLVGTSLYDYYRTEDPDFYPIMAHRLALMGESSSYELHWEGTVLSCYVEPMRDKTNKIIGVIGISFDITGKKQAEEALRALSRRLVDIQESERRVIASELHDEIGQTLTALKLMINQSTRAVNREIPNSLVEAQSVVTELIRQVRELSLRLRPSMLDDLGLLPTLLWHIERYSAQTEVKVNFEHDGLHKAFPPAVNTAVYRIVQEALTNVARHACTKEVSVRIWTDDRQITLMIEDRGCGFNPEALSSSTSTGISGMRERVLLLGGKLNIETSPGKGTCLTAELPIRENN